jgi:hypothetical protein
MIVSFYSVLNISSFSTRGFTIDASPKMEKKLKHDNQSSSDQKWSFLGNDLTLWVNSGENAWSGHQQDATKMNIC